MRENSEVEVELHIAIIFAQVETHEGIFSGRDGDKRRNIYLLRWRLELYPF